MILLEELRCMVVKGEMFRFRSSRTFNVLIKSYRSWFEFSSKNEDGDSILINLGIYRGLFYD